MRMRKKKNLTGRMEACCDVQVLNPEELKGKWREHFAFDADTVLNVEIGCGKGGFIVQMAKQNPDQLFVAVERVESVLLVAMEKAQKEELDNLLFISYDASRLDLVFDKEEADRIYERHMKNPREFWTPYPFPSMAICDPASRQDRPGNSWGFYTQGLTALRALRWMDHYGKSADLEYIMERWVHALSSSDDIRFSQELHPITGRPSTSSRWYSSVMLFYVWACRRLGYAE